MPWVFKYAKTSGLSPRSASPWRAICLRISVEERAIASVEKSSGPPPWSEKRPVCLTPKHPSGLKQGEMARIDPFAFEN